MAPLVIYGCEISPPVRSVLMTARCLGINYDFKEINLMNKEQMKPEYVKMNPQHTVPTIDDNGFILWESAAICAYLVGKCAKNDCLYPKDLQKRAVVDQRLHFVSGTLFPRFRNIVQPCLQGKKEISKECEECMIEAYCFMEKFLCCCTWLASDQMTIADLNAISIVTSICQCIPIDGAKFPKLTAWVKKCKECPCYQANCKGCEQLCAKLKQCCGR